jgi:hypothetical protein
MMMQHFARSQPCSSTEKHSYSNSLAETTMSRLWTSRQKMAALFPLNVLQYISFQTTTTLLYTNKLIDSLTPWRWVHLEKPPVARRGNNFATYYELRSSKLYHFSEAHFNIIPWVSSISLWWFRSSRHSHKSPVCVNINSPCFLHIQSISPPSSF